MKQKGIKGLIFWFLVPSLILYFIIVVFPMLTAFGYSVTRWNGLTEPKFVGLEFFGQIFKELFTGGPFQQAFLHNVFLTLVPTIFSISIALFFASVLHRGIRGGKLFRVVFFFPNIISAVAIVLLWQLIYISTDTGIANRIIGAFGFQPVEWLRPNIQLVSLVPAIVWTQIGFFMILFLAAMQSIPESLYESAKLEGASNAQSFFRITIPLIKDTIVTALVFAIIGGLKFFDMIWVVNSEAPSPDTHTMATLFYQKVFKEMRVGYGTAISVVLFLIVIIVTVLLMTITKRERIEY